MPVRMCQSVCSCLALWLFVTMHKFVRVCQYYILSEICYCVALIWRFAVASVCMNLSFWAAGILYMCMSECMHIVMRVKMMMRRSKWLVMECFQVLSAESLGLFV